MNKVCPCLKIVVSSEEAEELPWVLQDLGAIAVETRDNTTMTASDSDQTILLAGFDTEQQRDAASENLRINKGLEALALDVGDDGWSSKWRDFFKPVILDSLVVITPWMEDAYPEKQTVVIDPGLAFGTGGHATTKLILSMLEQRAKTVGLQSRVLDVGIGSGVLSIAAALLGVKNAYGVDIDDESIEATAENATRNNVAEQVSAEKKTACDVQGTWPLVLANIELRVFETEARHIAPLVAEGGEVLISGLLEEHVDRCLELWPGFELKEKTGEKGWAAIALKRIGE